MTLPTPSQLEQGISSQNAKSSYTGTAVKDIATVEIMSRKPSTENSKANNSKKLKIRECREALDNEEPDECKSRLKRIVTEQIRRYGSLAIRVG
jgi:hypothetical protein